MPRLMNVLLPLMTVPGVPMPPLSTAERSACHRVLRPVERLP